MGLKIERNEEFAESNVTIIGLTRAAYGRPQFILTSSDNGDNPKLKFPGLKFRSPRDSSKTLEDAAIDRFEEQTGLTMYKSLGLRTIIPTRSRHGDRWMFRNVFVLVVNDPKIRENDGRDVYVADPGQGFSDGEYVQKLGSSGKKTPLEWVVGDNKIVSRVATDILYNFNWKNLSTNWYNKIPCLKVEPQTETYNDELGCALAVSSMMLLYQPNPNDSQKVITLRRKQDRFPGYAGGKIERLASSESKNIDPISCCAEEGSEEFGFKVQPRSLIGVATTPLYYPKGGERTHYNAIVNYAFVAEPTNSLQVKEALDNPRHFLEDKMAEYVVEDFDEHRDRVFREELRMPDMVAIANQFYAGSPGSKISLDHIRASGSE